MLFKPGVLVQTLSGSVGGATFVVGKQGGYIRGRGLGVISRSESLGRRRLVFQNAGNAWAALTEEERLTWVNLATRVYKTDRVAVRKNYSGRSLFIREYLWYTGLFYTGWPTTAPINGGKQGFRTWLVEYSGGFLGTLFTFWEDPWDLSAAFYGCRSFSTVGFSRRNYKYFSVQFTNTGGVFDLTSDFVAMFGEPAVGERISIGVRCLFNGFLVSDLDRLDITVEA